MALQASVQRRIDADQCITCGSPLGPEPHPRRCRQCAERQVSLNATRRARAAAMGKCPCGREIDRLGAKTCKACRSYKRQDLGDRRAASGARRNAQLCTVCGKERIGQSTRCLEHYLQGVAKGAHRERVRWEDLLAIYNAQNGLCYYTGIPLVFGKKNSPESAHLDHKKPKSRFPELAWMPSNLVFCSGKVNMWKGFKTDDEFIALCTAVVEHRRRFDQTSDPVQVIAEMQQ